MSQSPISHRPSPIFLLGFMAAGKSTVGRALAARLDAPFLDLDEMIVARAGQPIAAIIQTDGEAYFRQLETACLQEAAQTAVVIALGGGAFISAVNRELVARSGISVWLDAPFELCWERIQSDGVVRPLALTETAARARYQERIPFYQQAKRHIRIHADDAPEAIATIILSEFS